MSCKRRRSLPSGTFPITHRPRSELCVPSDVCQKVALGRTVLPAFLCTAIKWCVPAEQVSAKLNSSLITLDVNRMDSRSVEKGVDSLNGASQAAFSEDFGRLYPIAYRAGYRLLGSREDAEDIAIESLSRAYVKWERIRSYSDAWVARVAINLALDEIRRRRTRRPELGPKPDQPQIELRLELQEALRQLPRRQQEAILLRYFYDLSEADSARVMGVSSGAVKQHCSRGRLAIHDFLTLRQ